MKRGKSLFFGIFAVMLFSLFSINFVSAADFFGISPGQAIADGLNSIEELFNPILQTTIGGYDTGEFFWVKFLLLILLFVLVKAGVKATPKLGENNAVANIVALVISLFAVRFISQNGLTEGILLPYGVLGVALTTILPFLIFFFFVEKTTKSPGGRKILWLFFVMIMFLLWFNRTSSFDNPISNWIYWGIIALGIGLFFFDKHVQLYFGTRANYETIIHAINLSLSKKHTEYRDALNLPGDAGEELRKKILGEIKKLEKEKHKYS